MNPQTETKSILDNPKVLERVIIYARVSTDEQAESGTSIDNQVERSLAYATGHNMNVVAIFKEDYTGKALDRPELNKVRDMLRAGLADNVIVYKTNRLDRSEWGLNLLILLQEFKQLGVSLHYSQSGRRVDLTNPVEALMQSIEGWQAGEDHRETVTKLHEGRLKRARDGYVVPHGLALFGYRATKGYDKRWYLEINEAEGEIVRMIFTWYTEGDESGQPLTMHRIAGKLNAMGIPTRRGSVWCKTTVGRVLSNETYCGTWYYGKKGKQGKNPKEHHIAVSVPAIVSREVWEAAQARLAHNIAYSERNRKRPYLFANRVQCGCCGYRMSGTGSSGDYSYYRCPSNRNHELKGRRECDSPGFSVSVADTRLWDKLEEAARDEKTLIEGLKGYQAQQESKADPVRQELGYVEQLLKEKNAEWEGAYLDQKLLTSERAKARKAVEIDQIEQVIKELERRRGELLADLEEKTLTDEQIMGLAAFTAQVVEDLDTIREAEARGLEVPELKAAVFEEKRKLLEMLDVQVTLYVEDGRKKGDITAKFFPNGEVFAVELNNSNVVSGQSLTMRRSKSWLPNLKLTVKKK